MKIRISNSNFHRSYKTGDQVFLLRDVVEILTFDMYYVSLYCLLAVQWLYHRKVA